MTTASLKRTPLFDAHVAAGAKIVDFGGFAMPLKYSSETVEHMAVRSRVGIFDVSHMGEVFVEGPDALAFMQHLVTNDAARIADGQAMYAGLLNARGTFLDDVVVYRFSATRFLVCVNASNQDKDHAWMKSQAEALSPSTQVTNASASWAQLAIQGPHAVDVVSSLCGDEARTIGPYHFRPGRVCGAQGIVARTGYTGEDGFELYVHPDAARNVWDAALKAGAEPCGLACRDTLRLEAGMCLYGNDIDEDHTPLEANLGWIVKFDGRPPFVGMSALLDLKAKGIPRILRGLEMIDRGIARHGYTVHDDAGHHIGTVTSGTQAPAVGKAIAMAYLDTPWHEPGQTVNVDVRGRKLKARVVKLPFYKRPR